eukprot:4266387-Pleurochrysis_carterae.AAC.1
MTCCYAAPHTESRLEQHRGRQGDQREETAELPPAACTQKKGESERTDRKSPGRKCKNKTFKTKAPCSSRMIELGDPSIEAHPQMRAPMEMKQAKGWWSRH